MIDISSSYKQFVTIPLMIHLRLSKILKTSKKVYEVMLFDM